MRTGVTCSSGKFQIILMECTSCPCGSHNRIPLSTQFGSHRPNYLTQHAKHNQTLTKTQNYYSVETPNFSPCWLKKKMAHVAMMHFAQLSANLHPITFCLGSA